MKRLLFLLSFLLVTNCFSQDTLLWENYQYNEVELDSADFCDIANTPIILLPGLPACKYYDIFKIILEFEVGTIWYSWTDDNIAIGIGNSMAFVPVEFMHSAAKNVCVINALTGRPFSFSSSGGAYGYNSLGGGADSALRMISWMETSPAICGNGKMLVKIWYRVRIDG